MAPRLTVTVRGRPSTSPEAGSTSSSVTISTAVVRGLVVEEEEDMGSGVGNAARRVLAGAGTVTVWVAVIVWVSVSYDVSETINGGSSWKVHIEKGRDGVLLRLRARSDAVKAAVPWLFASSPWVHKCTLPQLYEGYRCREQ